MASRLTVVIPAFNAAKYIRETLDSVFAQKTSFGFDVFVSDDCSTDDTYEICCEYASRFSNFTVLRQAKNLGLGCPNPNTYFVASYAKTEFIAHLDADDVYACADFLERQVQFLIANPNVSKVFSNVEIFSESGVLQERFNSTNRPPTTFNLSYYFENLVPICNSSTVYRYSMTNQIPFELSEYIQFDWLLHIHHGLHGLFGYNDFTGVKYRVHATNSTNQKNTERLMLSAIKLVYNMHRFVPHQYHHFFTHPRFEINSLALHYLSQRRIFDFLKWYFKWLKVTPFRSVNWRDQFYLFRQALFNR